MRSGFFTSVNGDRTYTSDFFTDYFASLVGNGVFPNPSNGIQVVASNGLDLIVNKGTAWINGHILHVDNEQTLTLNPGNSLLPRIDKVVARLSLSERAITLEVKEGVPSSNPIAQTLQRDGETYELGLADIHVGVNSATIAQRDITDLRWNPNQCGIVTGLVDQIDTTEMYSQYHDWFNDRKQQFINWLGTVEDVLDDETGGMLLNLINSVDDKADNLLTEVDTLKGRVSAEEILSGELNSLISDLEGSKMENDRIIISPSNANADNMNNGDVWLKYGDS